MIFTILSVYKGIRIHSASSILISVFQPNTQCVFLCDAVDDRKSDHFVISNFVVASRFHHNTLGRRLNKLY